MVLFLKYDLSQLRKEGKVLTNERPLDFKHISAAVKIHLFWA
jgi:hypothetical protein